MLPSRLARPDFPSEHWEHAHSPSVARALRAAWPLVKCGSFQLAQARIARVRDWPMSLGQRLRILFIDGLAARACDQYKASIDLFDEALALALRLDASDDIALLAAELAMSCYFAQRFADAVIASGLGLRALVSLPRSTSLFSVPLALELRHRLGICLVHFGESFEGRHHLFAAYRLAQALPDEPTIALKLGGICWDTAFMHRIAGDLTSARFYAEQGLPLLAAHGSPRAYARLQLVLANILLDRVAPNASPTPLPGQTDLLVRAQTLVCTAHGLLSGSSDPTGRALAFLAQSRLTRLQGIPFDHVGAFELIEHVAREFDDYPLLAKLYTARAYEFLASSETETAIWSLRQARAIFEAHQAAESVFAFRLLRVSEEMRD